MKRYERTNVICWVRIRYWGEGYGCGYDFPWTLGDHQPLDFLEEYEVKDALTEIGEEQLRTDQEIGWPRSFLFALEQEDYIFPDAGPYFSLSREIHPPLWVKRAFRRWLESHKR